MVGNFQHSSQAAVSASEEASALTKGKNVFKRIFHRRVDKEVCCLREIAILCSTIIHFYQTKTIKKSGETGIVNEQENKEV